MSKSTTKRRTVCKSNLCPNVSTAKHGYCRTCRREQTDPRRSDGKMYGDWLVNDNCTVAC